MEHQNLNMANMAGAKPCPFCGEAEDVDISERGFESGSLFVIDCGGCGANVEGVDWRARGTPGFGTPLEALNAWNTRAGTCGEKGG